MTRRSSFWRQMMLGLFRTGVNLIRGLGWGRQYQHLLPAQDVCPQLPGATPLKRQPGRPRKIRPPVQRPFSRPVCPMQFPQPRPKTPFRTIKRQRLVTEVLYEAWMQGYRSYADLSHYVKCVTGQGSSYRTIRQFILAMNRAVKL